MLTTNTNDVAGITPDTIAALVTTPVTTGSKAMQASTVIATASTRTHIPLITGDPSAAWVAEGAEIAPSDPTVDDLVVEPAKVAGLTIITNELARDSSPEASTLVGAGLTRNIIAQIDSAFFGSKGASLVQPEGLEDLLGVNDIDAGADWSNLDAFAEAIASVETLGLNITSFVANPTDALALAVLKDQAASNRPLLGVDASNPTRRLLQGVQLLVSPAVTVGTIWGIPKERAIVVRRTDVELAVDKSAYFTSDRTAVRATMRVGFAFPDPAAIQKISLTP